MLHNIIVETDIHSLMNRKFKRTAFILNKIFSNIIHVFSFSFDIFFYSSLLNKYINKKTKKTIWLTLNFEWECTVPIRYAACLHYDFIPDFVCCLRMRWVLDKKKRIQAEQIFSLIVLDLNDTSIWFESCFIHSPKTVFTFICLWMRGLCTYVYPSSFQKLQIYAVILCAILAKVIQIGLFHSIIHYF